jgi:hypothetical protein
MTKTVINGRSALNGPVDWDKFDRQGTFSDRERDAYERDLEDRYAKVQGWLALELREQLQAAAALPVITAEVKSDFARFEKYCTLWRYPALPTDSTPVAEFIRIVADNATHAERLRHAVSIVHRSLKLADPTINDPLVNAAVRFFHDEEAKQPSPPRQAKARKPKSASSKEV